MFFKLQISSLYNAVYSCTLLFSKPNCRLIFIIQIQLLRSWIELFVKVYLNFAPSELLTIAPEGV